MQKVIINAGLGGVQNGVTSENIIEKEYNLEISKKIYDKLRTLGVNAYLVRTDDITLSEDERLEIIEEYLSDSDSEVIVLTNILSEGLESGAEIVYALRNADTLANEISQGIEDAGQEVLKFYQLRDPNNTALDYYDIIKNTDFKVESIVVSYGYPMNNQDNFILSNNIDVLASNVAMAIYSYLTRANIYVVKSGDSLYSIAKKFETTVQELKELNGLSSNALQIGQELIIPKKETIPPSVEPPINDDKYILYAIKAGDTLYSIAKKYNTTVDAIKNLNNLTSNNLTIGEVLKLPIITDSTSEENYIMYTVKQGDTLYSLAKMYDTTVSEIKKINNLLNDNLSLGQILKIPHPNSNSENNYLNYIVKRGDTLYQIARNYGTSVSVIKDLNSLKSDNLAIGQVLKIPI